MAFVACLLSAAEPVGNFNLLKTKANRSNYYYKHHAVQFSLGNLIKVLQQIWYRLGRVKFQTRNHPPTGKNQCLLFHMSQEDGGKNHGIHDKSK